MKYHLLTFLVMFLFSSWTEAGLQAFSVTGKKLVIYDDKAKLAWLADMSDSSILYNKDYSDQVIAVSKLNTPGNEFYGLRGWHIATESDLDQLLRNNDLYDIAKKFNLYKFKNTNVAVGRYENSITPPKQGHHHVFNLTYLENCEPNCVNPGFPYEQLIENPGKYDDHLLHAHPRPLDGNIDNNQLPDDSKLGAWVATGKAMLVGGKLVNPDSIKIRPPFWKDPTVYGLSALAIILAAWFMFKKKEDD